IHQSDFPGFRGIESASSIGQFTRDSVRHELWQALQRADVGGDAEVDLLDRKVRFGRSVTHVATSDEIDPAADARAVNRGDDRLATALDGGERILQFDNLPPQPFAITAVTVVMVLLPESGDHAEIEARG